MATLFKTKRTIREAINSYTDGNDDPLTRALLPDPGESEEERIHRIEKFNEAQKVSREIDAEILESKKTFEKKNKAIKILLLGKSSTVARAEHPIHYIVLRPQDKLNLERVQF